MKAIYLHAGLYFFFCLFPIVLSADDYQILWADTLDNGNWDGASCVAVDSAGNIIVAGCSFLGSDNDYCIVKYNPDGMVLWQDTVDNGGEDLAEDVAVDRSNNVIMTGYSMISGDYDYFTIKYDPNGGVLWQDILDNGGLYDIARGVAVDRSNNIVVTGYSDIDGQCVYYTVKYDSGGTIIWTDTLNNGLFDCALDVAVDRANNIVVTGYTSTGTNNDYFTVKYDSSGTILWADTIDVHQYDQAYGVAVDNNMNIIVTGCSGDPMGDYNFYTVRYDSQGTVLWADELDFNNSEDVAYGIAADESGSIFIAGYSLELSADYDYYTVKYDSNGNILWQDTLNNGNDDIAFDIAVDDEGNVIETGRSFISDDFDYFTVKYAPVQGMAEKGGQNNGSGKIRCHAHPNPFSSEVRIQISEVGRKSGANHLLSDLCLTIYDASGRRVKCLPIPNSEFPILNYTWDGTGNVGNRLPEGIYFLVFKVHGFRGTRKLLLVR